MKDIYFELKDDIVLKHTPVPEMGEHVYKTEVVMTRELFRDCYIKWILPEESEIHYKFTDEELAKSFIEDVEAGLRELRVESEDNE